MTLRLLGVASALSLVAGCVTIATDLIGPPSLSRTELPFSGGAVTVSVTAGPGLNSQSTILAIVTYPDGSTRQRAMVRGADNPTSLEVLLSLPANGAGPGEEQRYGVIVRATSGNATQEETAGTVVVAAAMAPPAPPFSRGVGGP